MKRGFVKPFIQFVFLFHSVVWLYSQDNLLKVGDRVIELDDDILFENFDLSVPRQPRSPRSAATKRFQRTRRYANDRDAVEDYVLTNIYNSYITNVFIFSNYFLMNDQNASNKQKKQGEVQHPVHIYMPTNSQVDPHAFKSYFASMISNIYNMTNEYKAFFNRMLANFRQEQQVANAFQPERMSGASPMHSPKKPVDMGQYKRYFNEVVSNLYFDTNEYNYYYNDFNSNYVAHIHSNQHNYYYSDFYSSYITNNFFNTNEHNYFYSEITSNIYNYSNYSNLYNVSNIVSNVYHNTNDYNFYYTEVVTNTQSNIVTNTYNISNYYGVVVGEGVDAQTLDGAKIGAGGKLVLPEKDASFSKYINIPVLLLQARELARKKQYHQALTLIGIVEKREPNNTRMLNMKGSIFYKLQFYDYALEAWGKSLGINSQQPIVEYYYNRAAVLLRTIR